jgi:hypothetical protein
MSSLDDLEQAIAALPPTVNPYVAVGEIFRSKMVPHPEKVFAISSPHHLMLYHLAQ